MNELTEQISKEYQDKFFSKDSPLYSKAIHLEFLKSSIERAYRKGQGVLARSILDDREQSDSVTPEEYLPCRVCEVMPNNPHPETISEERSDKFVVNVMKRFDEEYKVNEDGGYFGDRFVDYIVINRFKQFLKESLERSYKVGAEAVIEDIPERYQSSPTEIGAWLKPLKQQLRDKHLNL